MYLVGWATDVKVKNTSINTNVGPDSPQPDTTSPNVLVCGLIYLTCEALRGGWEASKETYTHTHTQMPFVMGEREERIKLRYIMRELSTTTRKKNVIEKEEGNGV